jgi:hypothetical protein
MTEKRKRRWLQFSLRTLFVLTTVLAVWVGSKANRARQQKEAVEFFLDVGGSITYHHQVDRAGKHVTSETPFGWMGLRDLIGGEYFDSVYSLYLRESNVTGDDLRQLRGLRGLEQLRLGRTQVADSGIEYIGEVKSLRDLWLTQTRITDASLEHLRGLPHLRQLTLDGTAVTDEGMPFLADLRSLESVSLIGTGVTEAGVHRLVEAGKSVCCVLDAHICALDRSGKPTEVLWAGQKIPLLMTFNVPAGATLRSQRSFIISIVGRAPDGRRVILQQGHASAVRTSPTTYEVRKVLHLKSPRKTAMPGELEASVSGVDVCVERLDQLRPARNADTENSAP